MAETFTFLLTLLLLSLTKPIFSVQPYDRTPCNTTAPPINGSIFTCNANKKTCNTYVVYRPQFNQTLLEISRLFNVNDAQLNSITHLKDREVVIPIVCNCPDFSSRAIMNYTNDNAHSFSDIACGVYQGLVKPFVLAQQNGNVHESKFVNVPIKCACVDSSDEMNDTRYLVTYPVMEGDALDIIARKFGVTEESIHEVNGLDRKQTIFGGTTLLVLTTGTPILNLGHVATGPSSQDTIPVNAIPNRSMKNRFSVFLIIFVTIFLIGVVLFFVFLMWKCRRHHGESPSVSVMAKRFSPDFLDDMSKLKQSLTSFSFDELKLATLDFSQSLSIGEPVYKGQIACGSFVVIKKMYSAESAYHVVNILTTINHFNVVMLEGCCFDMNQCFLVFEFAENGSLRDCLHDSKMRKQLTWKKRLKIAFDLAEGLHYIHYCTKPTYVHRNISSGNVLITGDWRAKISGFNLATPIVYIPEADVDGGDWNEMVVVEKKGYLALEYVVDVYAYGVILLELLSAKEAVIGRKWLDLVEFLADGEVVGGSEECLEKFKLFMDVDLEGDYGLGDAMCLALLAKCCIQDDPQIRPTMNDILKTLSRIL